MSRNYDPDEEQNGWMADLQQHLGELRYRLLFISIAAIIATIGLFFYSDMIIDLTIKRTLASSGIILHFFDITEPFTFRFKVSFISALYLIFPLILFHSWRFVAPALHHNEKRYIIPVLLSSIVMFYCGSALSFVYVLPQSISMMMQFAPADMPASINAVNFLSFITIMVFFSGIFFEMPVISFVLTRLGIIDHKMLNRKRKYAIVVIWIIAAVITPPDVISQIITGSAITLLYEISVIIAFIAGKRNP